MAGDENCCDTEVRVRRLLAMALDLEARPATTRMLAERYGISQEQVARDIETLRGAGIAIERTSAGSYLARLRPLPGAMLSVMQAAQALDVSISVIHHELWRGRLEGTKDRRGHWRITGEAVDAYRRDYRYELPRRHRNRKVTPDAVRAIRQRHADGEPVKALAHDYDIAVSTVYHIVNGTRWAGVE